MLQAFSGWLLAPSALTPHGFCLVWEPALIWSFVVGDAATGLAYFGIPVALARFVRRRSDLALKPVFWLFAAFILLCGTTHWLELLTIWVPAYRLEALLKLGTALVSVATMVALWRLLPQALALPSPVQMQVANEALKRSEAALAQHRDELERLVDVRTTALAASEARLRDLLATLDLGAFVTCDPGGTIRHWSEGCVRLYGWTSTEAVGQNLHELLRTAFPHPLPEIEAALERGGEWAGDVHQRTRSGQDVTIAARRVLRRGPGGQREAVLESLVDVTESRQAERERQRSDALLHAVVAAAPGLIFAKDRQGRMVLANGPVLELIGKPWAEVEGRTDREYLDDLAQAEAVMANDCRVMEGERPEETEELVGTAGGGRARVWLSTKTPLRDGAGLVVGLVGVSVEITERKQAEDRLQLMLNELNHRVKNTLVTVQAIVSQTLRGADPAVRRTLEGRLLALAGAHDVLTREQWEGAELLDVVAGALAPHGGTEDGRFQLSGPPLRLNPRAALAMAMGLHELATNALKYGALSVPAGRVGIDWVVPAGDSSRRFCLTWTERGGPPVALPARRGFGTNLVERILAQDLGGTVRIGFDDPAGATCVIQAPLGEVAALAEVVPFPRVGGGRGA